MAGSIADCAPKLEVNHRLPLQSYYRIAESMLRQASIYRAERNIVELYIILLRFTSLVTETIPEHYAYQPNIALRKKGLEALKELERLKPIAEAEWEKQKAASSRFSVLVEVQDGTSIKYYPAFEVSNEHRRFLDAIRPREETVSRHSYFNFQPPKPKAISHESPTKVNYPSNIQLSFVDMPSLDQNWSATSVSAPLLEDRRDGFTKPPELPQFSPYDLVNQLAPPPVPAPVQRVELPPQQPSPLAVADPRPGPATQSEQKGPKHVHVSTRMMEEFLAMARANTLKNLETCGVLAGTLEKGLFSVTTLIVPKQEATSDSCQTVNEEELFEVQDQRNLFQLGWIHTHPTQTCFMSSIDLHTHYSYQVMLREAIAIVMAPTDEERSFGIFRLSEPGGMKTIQQCDQRGFHPHEEPLDGGSIYDHCSHVYMNPSLRFDIVDLRKST